jgi:hypothetical protein
LPDVRRPRKVAPPSIDRSSVLQKSRCRTIPAGAAVRREQVKDPGDQTAELLHEILASRIHVPALGRSLTRNVSAD